MDLIKINITDSPQRAMWIKIWKGIRFGQSDCNVVGLQCSRAYLYNQRWDEVFSCSKITNENECDCVNIYNYDSQWFIEISSFEFAEIVLTIFAVVQ